MSKKSSIDQSELEKKVVSDCKTDYMLVLKMQIYNLNFSINIEFQLLEADVFLSQTISHYRAMRTVILRACSELKLTQSFGINFFPFQNHGLIYGALFRKKISNVHGEHL